MDCVREYYLQGTRLPLRRCDGPGTQWPCTWHPPSQAVPGSPGLSPVGGRGRRAMRGAGEWVLNTMWQKWHVPVVPSTVGVIMNSDSALFCTKTWRTDAGLQTQ